jgi:glucokinase
VLIAGDIGGTHARLTLLAPGGRVVRHEVFESRTFLSLEAVVRAFLGKKPPRITRAAFGVAGPVVGERCQATNLPWVIDARSLSRKLRIRRVMLLNDLVALAIGALEIRKSKLVALGPPGVPRKKGGNVAVIAAGTGLGEAMLVWDPNASAFLPSPTEGGHSDFAPGRDVEDELLRYLRARHGHVSWERVLSGSGLGAIYDFFTQTMGESAENRQALEAASDRNAAVAQLGAQGTSEAAARAVDLFARLYGAEAGNLALKTLAVGGVYVCGNIAAKMLPVLERGGFRAGFEDKGRFRVLMEKIPIAVVLDSDVGLEGAKRAAVG